MSLSDGMLNAAPGLRRIAATAIAVFVIATGTIVASRWPAVAASRPRETTTLRVIESKFAAVNRHDIAAIVASYADDAIVTASDFCAPRRGRQDVERTYRAIFNAVPDIRATIREAIVQDDRVAVRLLLSSYQPGRAFELPLMDFFTVRNGRIVRDDGIFDNRGAVCKP